VNSAEEFDVATPLGVRVRCTAAWWRQISTVKHPVMAGHLDEVIRVLTDPDEIRVSTKDPHVLLFYRGQHPRWLCAVTKREGDRGFLITAYPTDAVKAGEVTWTRSA
jgi:hypothetical protein